ncbi:MAG: helix-turn-helix domain-containing protein [Candidatus Omnitrophica bacterium]|nr:helix-turn-helix domain-containing protein [Candidatus Omnitrophota bacterium]
MAEQPYLSIAQVARRFSVTTSTVYRLAQRGVLPGLKIGGQWRFSQGMLESWVADQVTVEHLRAEDTSARAGGRARRRHSG